MAIQNTFKSYPHPVFGNYDDILNHTLTVTASARVSDGNYEFKIVSNIEDSADHFTMLEKKRGVFVVCF